MKHCARCGLTKPRADFHRSALRADGLQVYCAQCRAEIGPLLDELVAAGLVERV